MRIVFMGTPDFAVAMLKAVHESRHEVVAVVTAPDKPAGRGRKPTPSAVKEYAAAAGLTVLQPEKLRAPEFVAALAAAEADVFVVVAFRMLPEVVWGLPPKGTLNLHASLLPDYRGAAPIQWAVINGETETGLTTFFIDREIDTGRMILQTRLPIGPEMTAGELHDAMLQPGADLILQTLDVIERDAVQPLFQDEGLARHTAPRLMPETCRIDWLRPAHEVHNFIRGLSPSPCAWTMLDDKRFKIYRSKHFSEPLDAATPGTLRVFDKHTLLVQTGDGWLQLLEVQPEGRKRMSGDEFLRSLQSGDSAFQ